MKSRAKTKTTKKRQTKIVAVAVMGLALVAAGCLYVIFMGPNAPKYVGPMEHMSVGLVNEYSALSVIADDKGYFKDNGVQIDLKNYSSGAPAIADLLDGKIDTATAADFVGVSNSFNHEDLKIVATQGKAYSFFLVSRSDRAIKTAADLKGKRIGVTPKTAGEFYLGEYLTLHQLGLNDVTIEYMPPDQLVDGLVQGKLDAIATFDPHISEAQARLGTIAQVWSLQGTQRLSVTLYSTGAFTKAHPEAIKRYLSALLEAKDYIRLHDNQARAIVGNYFHYDDNYTQVVWSRINFDLALDEDLLLNMQDQARWAIENKVVPATTIPDYLQLIYFDGLEAMSPDSITIIR